jgi:hypothetical protein
MSKNEYVFHYGDTKPRLISRQVAKGAKKKGERESALSIIFLGDLCVFARGF